MKKYQEPRFFQDVMRRTGKRRFCVGCYIFSKSEGVVYIYITYLSICHSVPASKHSVAS